MTQEDKELLLKDLCARLPYGMKILHEGWNYEWDDELSTIEKVVGIDDKFIYTKVIDTHNGEEYRDNKHPIDTFDDKLFLRPMSSITKEEKEELNKTFCNVGYFFTQEPPYDYGLMVQHADADSIIISEFSEVYNWLNAHHFDYRGLIEKGLALEAPEGMYDR